MITLSTLITIWGLYSIYKIYQHNRKRGTPFDIGNAPSFFTYMGSIAFIYLIVILIIMFLP